MKRFFLLILSVVLISSIAVWADFAPSVSLSSAKEAAYTQGIGTVLQKFIKSRSESFLHEKFQLIHKKIGILFDAKTKLKNDDIFVLEFIDRTIVQWLNTYTEEKNSTGTTTNNQTTTSSATKTIDTDDYYEGKKTIVIDKVSWPVVRFKVLAEGEDIEVETFTIIASDDNFDKVIEKVYVYDTKGTLIGEDRPVDDTASFDDTFVLEKGDNYLYVVLKPFDNDTLNATYTFQLNITKSKGKTSKEDINAIEVENDEDSISIIPVTIGSIQLLNNYQGYFVDERMYNLAKADLAIISFSPQASNNDDDILLRGLEFTLQDNTTQGHIANTLYVQRIDAQSIKIPVDNINDNQVYFDLSNFGTKAEVKPGATVVLLVTGTPTLDTVTSEGVNIELDSDKTSNGIITYTTTKDTTLIGTKSQGYIGSTGITD